MLTKAHLPPKIQAETDIDLPPNFEIYSKNAHKVEELQLNLPPRLCENNPLVTPCLSSRPISFDNTEMKRLNLESLLNPQQNDIEFMEKEIQEYNYSFNRIPIHPARRNDQKTI